MKTKFRKYFISFLVFTAALIILFNEWVWDHLRPVLEYFSKFKFVQRLESWISELNPYVSLVFFLIPFVTTHVIEIWALGLVALGNVISGFIIYGISKVGGFMIMSRIFTLTKPKLLTVEWFAVCYTWFMEKKTWIHTRLDEMGVWKKIKSIKSSIYPKIYEIKLGILGSKRSIFVRVFARVKARISERDWKMNKI